MAQPGFVITAGGRKPGKPHGPAATGLLLGLIFRRHPGKVRYRTPNRPYSDEVARSDARTWAVERMRRTPVGGRLIFLLADKTRVIVDAVSPAKHYPPIKFDRCAAEHDLNLVTKNIKGKTVKLQAEAMAAYLRALDACPTLDVTASTTSEYSGSFRTHAQQRYRYQQYQSGNGALAAPECSSWHEAGLAVDILNPDKPDPHTHVTPRHALVAEGFHTFLPDDPPHHSYRVQTSNDQTYPQPKWAK